MNTRKSTIHSDRCSYYLKRKPDKDRLSNNWWHGPYETIKEAKAKARATHTMHVQKCLACSP